MKKLLIIGNGFDLAHGLKTSYGDFVEYCNEETKLTKNIFFDNLLKSKGGIWSDIEFLYFQILTNLGNENFFVNTFGQTFDYTNAKKLNIEFEFVKEELELYLKALQVKFIKLEAYEYLFSTFNSNQTLVLNFNYTDTVKKYLEKYKSINCVHIHGEINNPDNPIIFGFAANDHESLELSSKNEGELMRNIKRINYKQTNNETAVKNWLKNADEDIMVIILGHSSGISDKLILNQIFNHKNVDKIIPFYYNDREGYLQTSINIDRICDDYSKKKEEKKSFERLFTFPDCISMIQHNSDSNQVSLFHNFLNNIAKIQPTNPKYIGRNISV